MQLEKVQSTGHFGLSRSTEFFCCRHPLSGLRRHRAFTKAAAAASLRSSSNDDRRESLGTLLLGRGCRNKWKIHPYSEREVQLHLRLWKIFASEKRGNTIPERTYLHAYALIQSVHQVNFYSISAVRELLSSHVYCILCICSKLFRHCTLISNECVSATRYTCCTCEQVPYIFAPHYINSTFVLLNEINL